MVLMLAVATFAAGTLLGAALVKRYLTHLSQTARDNARYIAAVDLAAKLLMTPDALSLRAEAQKIIASHDAAMSANRKDS